MGRIILMMNVTLDGCCDHTQVIADEDLHQYTVDLMDKLMVCFSDVKSTS